MVSGQVSCEHDYLRAGSGLFSSFLQRLLPIRAFATSTAKVTLTLANRHCKNPNLSSMATEASDDFGRNDNDEKVLSRSPALPNVPHSQSASDTKTSQRDLAHYLSSIENIRKLAESCMTWCYKKSFFPRSSWPGIPIIGSSEESDNSRDGDDNQIREPKPTSISTSHLSNISWDCISPTIHESEHAEKPDERRHSHATPQNSICLLNSWESLSLQTIYDGEIFGGDHGSRAAGDQTDFKE